MAEILMGKLIELAIGKSIDTLRRITAPQYATLRQAEDVKQFLGTMVVAAGLLTTVTFAAAFTIPGGFDPSSGAATLGTKAALQVFILSDTLAMCFSIGVVFLLTWAMSIDNDNLAWVVANFGWRLLTISLLATLMAFMSGIYVVIAPKSLWVAVLVCIICSTAPFLAFFGYRFLLQLPAADEKTGSPFDPSSWPVGQNSNISLGGQELESSH